MLSVYEKLIDGFKHLDDRVATIEIATIPTPAGLFDSETRLSLLELPSEQVGQCSIETRLVLLESSVSALSLQDIRKIATAAAILATRSLLDAAMIINASVLRERTFTVEERITEITEVNRSPLVEESLGVDMTVPTHDSSPQLSRAPFPVKPLVTKQKTLKRSGPFFLIFPPLWVSLTLRRVSRFH
jgi:hypothetical protein